jgi:hypothetical protein
MASVFGEVSLHVPETIPPTILHDSSPLVHLDYAIVSECDMSGFMTGDVKGTPAHARNLGYALTRVIH